MKSKFVTILFVTLILLGSFGVKKSWGANCMATNVSYSPDIVYRNRTTSITFTITPQNPAHFIVGQKYSFAFFEKPPPPSHQWATNSRIDVVANNQDLITVPFTIDYSNYPFYGLKDDILFIGYIAGPGYIYDLFQKGCIVDFSFSITNSTGQVGLSPGYQEVYNGDSADFTATNLDPLITYIAWWSDDAGYNISVKTDNSSITEKKFSLSGKQPSADYEYTACISSNTTIFRTCGGTSGSADAQVKYVHYAVNTPTQGPTPTPCPGGNCPTIGTAPTGNSPFDPCKNLAGTEMGRCRACTGIDDKGQFNITSKCDPKQFPNIGNSCGTWTSLGCIPNDPPNLVGWIITLASGVAGGIAFLLILFGSFQIVTSGGVPEKIASGKDIITSALIGLLFIFLSVLILKVIGVQILGIPGWQ